ncbi:hypothetical protein SSX86_028044 [Deinandra increscens subsp. villosa]|uniref:Membrane-associated kinase regulator 6 n=1 Tax=Deinandra increscens subsp. villosa TaxID=3103831 RepID=A0AAP0GK14_9ASTR
METSQPLTTESFSYSWLINQKPSLDRIFDTNSIVSSRRASEELQNFCFDLPYSTNLVDADEIFCNGSIVPKSVNQIHIFSCPATPMVQNIIQKNHSHNSRKYSKLIADCRISTRKILRKCFSFLVRRRRTRVVDSSRNSVCMSSSKITNKQTDTRIEVYETTTSRRSKSLSDCDYTEGSVHEAIVHCKKSFGSVS